MPRFGFASAFLTRAALHDGESFGCGCAPYRGPALISELPLFMKTSFAAPRAAEIHQPDRITFFIRLWPRDPGHRDRDIGAGGIKSAFGHCQRNRSADSAVLLDQRRRYLESSGFLCRRINDEAAFEMFGCSGCFAEDRGDKAAGAGFADTAFTPPAFKASSTSIARLISSSSMRTKSTSCALTCLAKLCLLTPRWDFHLPNGDLTRKFPKAKAIGLWT